MSNDAFHHNNPKVTRALVLVLGIMNKRGSRQGQAKPAKFVPGIWENIYPRCREELGTTPAAQQQVIEQALDLALDRGLLIFDRKTKKLTQTRKGWRARRAMNDAKNDDLRRSSSRDRRVHGRPAFAR